jgi:hypothetical protein
MNLDFTEIEFNGDLTDLDTDELADLVREYQEAQESNRANFEEATETLDDFEEFDDSLTERVTDETSLPESEAERLSFSGKRDLLGGLEDDETEVEGDEGDGDEGDGEFNDLGNTKGETDPDEETESEFVSNAVPDRFQLDE